MYVYLILLLNKLPVSEATPLEEEITAGHGAHLTRLLQPVTNMEEKNGI